MFLDRRDWTTWLDLYTTQAAYRVPAWRNDYEEAADPDREVSLIYHDSRVGLEVRVMRICSGQSVTALLLLPRTTHFVSNIVGTLPGAYRVAAQAS